MYCKETRVPTCGVDCKIEHLRQLRYMQMIKEEIDKNNKGPEIILKDLSLVTRYLCKLGFNDSCMTEFKERVQIKDNKEWEKQFKTYIFELILMILDKSGISLQQNEGFRAVVRNDLCEGLINNCVSVHENIFKLSASIFLKMVESFKFGIKNEIAVFIEDIFIKILESSTSLFQQKWSSLLVLVNLISKPRTVVELFVNYDCDYDYNNILDRIMKLFIKIIQGKFHSYEFVNMTPTERQSLRGLALDGMSDMLTNYRNMLIDPSVISGGDHEVIEQE